MDEGIKILVDTTIAKSKVVVFSKTYCPYCKRAKAVLAKYPIKPDQLEIIEIEKRPDCSSIQAYLKEITGGSTVSLFLFFLFFLKKIMSCYYD